MYYLHLILLLFSTTLVLASDGAAPRFVNFGINYSLLQVVNNFTNMLSSLKEILDFVVSEKPPELPVLNEGDLPEDAHLNITMLAQKYGYEMEEHQVFTSDGYGLGLHRIPRGKNGTNGMVAFLMHGILDSSDSWILQGPDKALAYVLADEGYDVWMGNARGNKHSSSHNILQSSDPKFWDFTFEQIGIYDLPAMIDYVLDKTNNESLYYVGYSQGTTTFYVMSSMLPEYNKKIKMMISLSPVAWMKNVKSPLIKMFSPAYRVLGFVLTNFDLLSPILEFFNKISSLACTFLPINCDNLLHLAIGSDLKYLNASLLPVISGHAPSESSMLQFVHFGQLTYSERFCQYDFGTESNLKKYGQTIPSDYDVTKITTPVIIYSSSIDWLSDETDVDTLESNLPNVKRYTLTDFNHLDFVYGSIAKDVIYDSIVNEIHRFENGNGTSFLRNVST